MFGNLSLLLHLWTTTSMGKVAPSHSGTILNIILHLNWLHMKLFMVRLHHFSFHTPPIVHKFRKLTWFFETEIRFFTFCRTIFTWQETTWKYSSISTILSALLKSVIWFFFVCNLTRNSPWKLKGIRSWIQSYMGHVRFFRRLGLLLINWIFLLLLMFTEYFMSLVSRKSVHR